MAVSLERIQSDIESISRCTATPGNGATRPTFSPAWAESRSYVIQQALDVGCEIRTDAAGNVHARLKGFGWDKKAWLVGSHIDTVPHGGDYDGVAGVVAGLELLRSAAEDGVNAAIEMIIFAEEEGPTFGLGMLGSRGWVGELTNVDYYGLKNSDGQNYLEAGAPFGVDAGALKSDKIDPSKYHGLIEVHIEQGPGMWRRDQRLAVVNSIAGRRQITVIIEGEANHAGATSMDDRRDALVGAAACISGIEIIARDYGKGAVGTVGRLENHPNAINVIPDRVQFTVDFRCGDSSIVEDSYYKVRALVEDVCKRRNLKCQVMTSETIEARPMNPKLVERLASLGGGLPITVSGALHDSAVLAPIIPTVMIFIPSRDGISHNPAEFSRVEDLFHAVKLVQRQVRTHSLEEVNALSADDFVKSFGGIFEHSAWIAQRAADLRPFTDFSGFHGSMCKIVEGSSDDEKMSLIRAHPDLVGRLAKEGKLTHESTSEQKSAGLTDLSEAEIQQFDRYNAQYKEKFGFPFIICARQNKKSAILESFPKRLENTKEQEIKTALNEIYKIAELRLADAIWE